MQKLISADLRWSRGWSASRRSEATASCLMSKHGKIDAIAPRCLGSLCGQAHQLCIWRKAVQRVSASSGGNCRATRRWRQSPGP